ncbi:hypothetical protein J6590_079407 [Homalodisca vitripennis]|nr:hypothetical protein J6590_079407 [Homalodisca vitripennis]
MPAVEILLKEIVASNSVVSPRKLGRLALLQRQLELMTSILNNNQSRKGKFRSKGSNESNSIRRENIPRSDDTLNRLTPLRTADSLACFQLKPA